MSLTSILTDRDFQELRDKFKTDFLRPPFDIKTELKAPPLTSNYGIVGTAFDYLLRFFLQHHNRKTFIQRDTWVADHSHRRLNNLLSQSKNKEIATGFKRDTVFQSKSLLKLINDQYNQTKVNHKKYLKKGRITNELIANTIFLAKLDVYFRAGIIDKNYDYHDPDDIKDINTMISLVDRNHFFAKEKCYFNPTFGEGSVLVGGADADIIIDNTLIDIKATKHLKLEREHINQILGYYILSLIGGVNRNPHDRPIKNIGIYFARHGELWTTPLLHFGDQQKFHDFKEWFIQFMNKSYMISDSVNELLQKLKTQKQHKRKTNTSKGKAHKKNESIRKKAVSKLKSTRQKKK